MLKRYGPYVYATIHEFKNNISALLALMHAPDSDVKGVVLKNRKRNVAVLSPLLPDPKKGGPTGPGMVD